MFRKRDVVVIALMMLLCSSPVKSDEFSDLENTLLSNSEDTRQDDNHDINQNDKCISHTTEHETIEERGMIMKEAQTTSFIPSYCRHREITSSNGQDTKKYDEPIMELKRRNKRAAEILNTLHFETMHTLSPEQIRSSQANIMKRYMDTTVNPCDDFYSYACGNWAKYNSIPSDKVAYDTFEILRESLDKALKGLLSDDDEDRKKNKRNKRTHDKQRLRRHEKNAEIKAKNLFHSCMNYETIEKRGVEPLMELLETLGGWPLLDKNWDEKNFDWLELVANLRRYNNDILIMQYVGKFFVHNLSQ